MCTVSWSIRSQGYDLFFNRDELNTRATEIAPVVDESAGVKFIAPRDGEHGGTWLLTNEHGITVCLLNDCASSWQPDSSKPRFPRGHLVVAAADIATVDEVVPRIKSLPLANTAPFHLLVLAPGGDPLVLHWQGVGLSRRKATFLPLALTSSSFATVDVVAARLQCYLRYVRRPSQPQLAELAAFHRQHDPKAGAYSVAMRRPDAATRSFIHVSVDTRAATLTYERACWQNRERIAPVTLILARRAGSASVAA